MSGETEKTNAFPRLGINTAELIAEIERLLVEAAADKEGMGAVNWGDLGIADIEYRLSMLTPDAGPTCIVIVEEASPEAHLVRWLNARLDRDRFPNTYVECEW